MQLKQQTSGNNNISLLAVALDHTSVQSWEATTPVLCYILRLMTLWM